jgi:hypothetical protein
MIIGSDSDGYLVNFRISDKDVEFDRLGIIGTLECREGAFIYTKNNSKEPTLILGNSVLPHTANGMNPVDITSKGFEKDNNETRVNVKGAGDNSTLAYSIVENGKRVFKHKKTSLFIKELIL